MGIIIPNFPLGLDLKVDPFAEHEAAYQSWMFVYLSVRGFHSYLFPGLTVNEVLDEADKTIPMGYTQLWILEWRAAVRPRLGTPKRDLESLKLPFEKERVIEGKSYVILTEPGNCLGWVNNLPLAMQTASEAADTLKVMVAVGLLAADVTWH